MCLDRAFFSPAILQSALSAVKRSTQVLKRGNAALTSWRPLRAQPPNPPTHSGACIHRQHRNEATCAQKYDLVWLSVKLWRRGMITAIPHVQKLRVCEPSPLQNSQLSEQMWKTKTEIPRGETRWEWTVSWTWTLRWSLEDRCSVFSPCLFVFEGFAERENKADSVSSPGQWEAQTWPLVC